MSASRILPFSPQAGGRILLALVVLVSSLAWLPASVQAAPPAESFVAASSTSPRLSAWVDGTRLYIQASGLPRGHIYAVRVRRSISSSWVKLGTVQANRQGALSKSMRLPSYLRFTNRLNVCLKDVSTWRLICTRASR
jgi:hypothetical protein